MLKKSNSGILLSILQNEEITEEERQHLISFCKRNNIKFDGSNVEEEIRKRSISIEKIIEIDTEKYNNYLKDITLR
jgi:hypothetical protein